MFKRNSRKAGSGTFIKIVPSAHKCDIPNATYVKRNHGGVGTAWQCNECSKIKELRYDGLSGRYYWKTVADPNYPEASNDARL
jgi:ribosomal protein L37AE/L43A